MPIRWSEEQIDKFNLDQNYQSSFKWLRLYIDWDASADKYTGKSKLPTLLAISRLFNPKADPGSGSSTRQDLEGREFHILSLPNDISDESILKRLQQALPNSAITEVERRTFEITL